MADLSSIPAVSLQRVKVEITVHTRLEGLDHRFGIFHNGWTREVDLETCETLVCQHCRQRRHPADESVSRADVGSKSTVPLCRGCIPVFRRDKYEWSRSFSRC